MNQLVNFSLRFALCLACLGFTVPNPARALCTSVDETELSEDDPFLSKAAFYIATQENNYRLIRFVSVGSYFNVEYCAQIGRNFSVEDYNEFAPELCETLSQHWISYSEAEVFHAHFVRHLKEQLEDQEFKDIEHTIVQGILARLDDVAWGAMGALVLKYVKAHPWRSGRFNAMATRATRGFGVFMIISAALGILADEEARESTNADVRALELEVLLNDHELRNQWLIGPNARDRAVKRIMEVLKQSLADALNDTFVAKCVA